MSRETTASKELLHSTAFSLPCRFQPFLCELSYHTTLDMFLPTVVRAEILSGAGGLHCAQRPALASRHVQHFLGGTLVGMLPADSESLNDIACPMCCPSRMLAHTVGPSLLLGSELYARWQAVRQAEVHQVAWQVS